MRKVSAILAGMLIVSSSVAPAADLCPVYEMMNHGMYTTYYAVNNGDCATPDVLDGPIDMNLGCPDGDCIPYSASTTHPALPPKGQPERPSVLVKVSYLNQNAPQQQQQQIGNAKPIKAKKEKKRKHKTESKLSKKGMKGFPKKSTKRAGVSTANIPVKHVKFEYEDQEYLVKVYWLVVDPKNFQTDNEEIKDNPKFEHGIGYQVAANSAEADADGTVAARVGRSFKIAVEVVEGDTRDFHVILKKGL